MTRATIVLANLRRRKARTILTILGLATAIFLFVTLRSVLTTMDAAGQVGSESRLIVRNAIGIVFPLPSAYRTRLEAMDGVSAVSWSNWFGGVYIDQRNFFPQLAIDAETYLPLYPEIVIPPDQREAFLSERTAALVGRGLVERFGWRLGQTVTLQGTIYPGEWRFTIRAIYESGRKGFSDGVMYFHYDYLEQALASGAGTGMVGTYVLGIDDPERAASIAAAVDAVYENSAMATRTETESAFELGFISMVGNIGFFLNTIGMAVVFAILLVTANTMAMSARERFPEVAVLKTVGFTDRAVLGFVLAESFVIVALGLGLGLGAALLLFNAGLVDVSTFFPGFGVAPRTVLLAAAIALALALISGAVPAWQSARLNVVNALRHTA